MTRFRIGGIAFLILGLVCAAAPAQAALPSNWAPFTVQPSPSTPAERFGESMANAGDLDADGRDDIVIGAPDYTDSTLGSSITGKVYALGTNGAPVWVATPPSPQAANRPGSDPTRFGAKVVRLGDVGSCQSTGDNCVVGGRDGKSELLVSAPGTDTGGEEGQDEGAVYVLDGATGRILKPVQLAERPLSGSAGFGKAVASLSGQPPCAGFGGTGACPHPADSAIALGDVDGGGEPDFAIGAPDFTESDTGPLEGRCAGLCPGIGRVYVFHGEAVAGSSVSPLTEQSDTGGLISFPGQIGDGEPPRFGSALSALGDAGSCDQSTFPCTPSDELNGLSDLGISAPGDDTTVLDAGTAFVVDPAQNAVLAELRDPQPVEGGEFGSFEQGAPAVGDLDGDGHPDVFVGAQLGAGAAVLFSGEVLAPSPIASFTDPSPVSGGAFGAAAAGLGNVAGDAPAELMLGAAGGGRSGSVHIASACARTILKTVGDPAGESGGGFGASLAPIGDRNADGFIDLAVGAPGSDGEAGKVYTFTSMGPAGAAFAGCGGSTGGGDTGGSSSAPKGTTGTPPKVRARVLRRLTLRTSKRRLPRGRLVRLRGSLKASAGQASCQVRQKIAIQRRKLKGGRFQTFDVAVTSRNGAFRATTRPSRSYVYRARVSQTAGCIGATSKRARVVVRKAARSRR